MKSRYVFAACVMLLALSQFLSAAEGSRRSSLSQKKSHPGVMRRILGIKNVENGLRVSFASEDMVRDITPRKPKMKKGKPGSLFSHAAAPAALKKDAQAALAALAQAKAAVVLSPCDEKTRVRSTRSELSNAKARQDAPKRVDAAKEACEDVRDLLNVVTITATRLNPVRRTDAFRVSKKRK